MIQAVSITLTVAAFAAWIMAVLSALSMMKHRTPGISGWWFATNGIAFFTGKNFEPGAAGPRRHFIRYAGFFALVIVAQFLLAVLGIARQAD